MRYKKQETIPTGLQLYSVRKERAKDFPGAIAQVAQTDYQGVEFAGYYDHTAKEVRKMLDDNGLQCCGAHTRLATLQGDELKSTIEYNQVPGHNKLIVPWLPAEQYPDKESWIKLRGEFNAISDKVKAQGMRVGYHNHTFDFNKIDNEYPWDIFCHRRRGRNIPAHRVCGKMPGEFQAFKTGLIKSLFRGSPPLPATGPFNACSGEARDMNAVH